MASTLLFTVIVIAVVIALIVISIFAAAAAVNLTKSAIYNVDPNAKAAHSSLTIAAALGWVSVVVLIIVLVIGFFAGGFTSTEISDAILQKSRPTATEGAAAGMQATELSSGNGARTVVLMFLILISIVTLIVGGLGVNGAIKTNHIATKDDPAKAAYVQSIVVAVTGIGTVGLLIVALFSWIGIRTARAERIDELKAVQQKAPPMPITVVKADAVVAA
jgi:amino acid transporter